MLPCGSLGVSDQWLVREPHRRPAWCYPRCYHDGHPVRGEQHHRASAELHDKDPGRETSAEIMSILVKKGATEILTHYGPGGMATGLKWRMETATGTLGFSLPINAEAVFEILTRDRVMKTNPAARMQQANRTAWRIIKEWILAQMALIETEMVTVEEVFLPYMLTGKQTLYQALSNGDLKMLPGADLDMLSSADIGD